MISLLLQVGRLAKPGDTLVKESILQRVAVSRDAHGSRLVAVVAHEDCAGNPADEEKQRRQIEESAEYLAANFPGISILGLWVDASWTVSQECRFGPPYETERLND
jgi:hypothetical protein